MLQKKQLLFSGHEINCYIYEDDNQKYYGYEFMDQNIFYILLPYQESWRFQVTLAYQYPIILFSNYHDERSVFKDIHHLPIESRFQLCLSFLEKIMTLQLSESEIYFFCDENNLWFDKDFNCELFYMPQVLRLTTRMTHQHMLICLSQFLFQHIQLDTVIPQDELSLYNLEYITFYQRVVHRQDFTSIMDIYDTLYQASRTYQHMEKTEWSLMSQYSKIMVVVVKAALVMIVCLYVFYAIVMVKNMLTKDYKGMYQIGNQNIAEVGDP